MNDQEQRAGGQHETPCKEEFELLRRSTDLRLRGFASALSIQRGEVKRLEKMDIFLGNGKLSAWASAKVGECYDEVEQKGWGRQSTAQGLLRKSTDFLRRIILQIEMQGRGHLVVPAGRLHMVGLIWTRKEVMHLVRTWVVNGRSLWMNRHRMHLIQVAERLGVRLPSSPPPPEQSMTKNSHLALNVRTDGARKNGLEKAKNPSSPPYPAEAYPSLLRTGMFADSSDELNDHRDVRTVDELRQEGHRPPCQSTATAGPSQFSALRTTWHLSLHTRACNNLVQNSTTCNCGISTVSSQTAHELAGPAQQTSNTLSMYCNWRISMVFWTIGNCLCATTELSTTLTQTAR